MKKILIYSVNPGSPHLAVDLELAVKLKKEGHSVKLLRCTGQLKSCLVNPGHSAFICMACKSKYKKAIQFAGLTDDEVITLQPPIFVYGNLPLLFNDIDELKKFQFEGAKLGVAVASTLIGRLDKDHKFDTLKYKSLVRRECEAWIDAYWGVKNALDQLKPDDVYLFNGRFTPHHPLLSLCQARGITYYTHERAGVFNKFVIRKNATPHNLDYVLNELNQLWSNGPFDKESIGSKFFIDRRDNVVQSWISFTESQRKGLLPNRFDREKRNIVIFNSTMEEYEGMDDWKNPIYEDDNDAILKILKSFPSDTNFVFYLRVHPNLRLLKNSQMREINEMAEQFSNLRLIRPEESVDSYALMEAAEKVLTFGSTMGAEATYWGKSSILAGKSCYMKNDICYEPESHSEVIALIQNGNLKPKLQIQAIKYGYWELAKGDEFEIFEQTGLHDIKMGTFDLRPAKLWALLEKLPKLLLVRNKRDIDGIKDKVKALVSAHQ